MTGWQDWINKGMNSLFDWYRGPSQNEFDYNVKQFIRNIPVIGGMFQADDSSRQMSDYLANRGLSWSDIRYNGTPFGPTYGSSLANVGVSAMNLYRSATRKPHARKGGRGRPPVGPVPTFMAGPRPRGGWSSTNPNLRWKSGHDRYHNNRMIPHKKF